MVTMKKELIKCRSGQKMDFGSEGKLEAQQTKTGGSFVSRFTLSMHQFSNCSEVKILLQNRVRCALNKLQRFVYRILCLPVQSFTSAAISVVKRNIGCIHSDIT